MVNGNPVSYDEIMIQQETEWEWLNSENHARMDILLPVVSWTPGQGLASPQAIRRFRFKSGADTFYLCSYYSRKFIEKIFPKISKFYHSSGLLILEIRSHDYFAGYQICFIIWKTLESNPPAFIGWGGSAAKKHGGASVKDHWTIGEWWVVLISILHTIHCFSTSKEWDNLGFGLTTKDTNMVAASSADGQLWWVQNRGNFFMGI